MHLPIEDVLISIAEVLTSQTSLVLVAPPGAGKTTRVPLALLTEKWLGGRRIVMLEPRRLAARAAARYMAALLGEQVGETVGYRVRMDSCVGPKTRIEVITEGILTRMLQTDPALEDVGLVIFDEFHERSLHADLGLALCLESQAVLREDLRLVVMSATIEAQPVAELLGHSPVIVSEGRAYPVTTHYLQQPVEGRIEAAVTKCVQQALDENSGDMLVFLPGAGEIRRVAASLSERSLNSAIKVLPLYGNLPQLAQDRAILPALPGERKIVLATSIAETSITVEGVTVVVDSGLMRVPRFSPRTGMTRLETVKVSQAAADQRRGRAGRLGPGVCYRLWTRAQQAGLERSNMPEIVATDLAPLALELAAWGIHQPDKLRWMDVPPPAAYGQAQQLLAELGALDTKGAITPHGRRMSETGLHPRLAHMVLRAIPLGVGLLACELAAIITERDILRGGQETDADLRLRVEALRQSEVKRRVTTAADKGALQRIKAEAAYWRRVFSISADADDNIHLCGLLLAFAYPDRIAQLRSSGRFLLSNGRGAIMTQMQPLAHENYLVAAELDDQGADSRIFLAAPVDIGDLRQHFADQIISDTLVYWDSSAQAVRARQIETLGALTLTEVPIAKPDCAAVLNALLQGIAADGLKILPWSRTARQLRQRLEFMHTLEPDDWPDVSEQALSATLELWLSPYLYGITSREELQRINLADILLAMLTWEQRRQLDEQAPTHITVPSGQRIPVDYTNPSVPVLAVRLQEMFGQIDTPVVGRGRVPLTLHLLSPAQRPVQVTRDLASFWRTTYFEVKKDLMGRYPKHYWPDDPLTAIATHRVRPRP